MKIFSLLFLALLSPAFANERLSKVDLDCLHQQLMPYTHEPEMFTLSRMQEATKICRTFALDRPHCRITYRDKDHECFDYVYNKVHERLERESGRTALMEACLRITFECSAR